MRFFKRSFLLSVCITFTVGYAVSDLGSFLVSNIGYYSEYQHERITHLAYFSKLSSVLLKYDDVRDLERQLDVAVEDHQLEFYLLAKEGKPLAQTGFPECEGASRLGPDSGIQVINRKNPSGTRETSCVAFRRGPYFLVAGFDTHVASYIRYLVRKNHYLIVYDIASVFLMVLTIAFFFFKDFRAVIQALKSPGKDRFRDLKPGSAEANLMVQGLKGYEARIKRLGLERGILSRHVTSAVRTELDLGRAPPYQFRCTMVRTDINRYSTIYSSHPIEPFMSVINEFFTGASAIIARYNGYVTDFVGDEIVYYFKDEDHADSACTALAAVREINELAEGIQSRTLAQNGYPFTVKSAVATGSLRFGPQVNGFALSGGAFVETVRILSQVDEKDAHCVYIPSRLASRVSRICRTQVRKTVELKGIPGVSELHQVTSFVSASEWLTEMGPDQAHLGCYFRSPEDVCRTLERAERSIEDRDGLYVPLMNAISSTGFPYTEISVRERLLSLMGALEGRCQIAHDAHAFFELGHAIGVSRRLVSRELYDSRFRHTLIRCLTLPDRRVVANAVDAFTHFDPASRDALLVRLLRHSDNRVSANALIKIGICELSREVVRGIVSLLKSEDPLYVSSGIFAAGELARYYLAEDPLVLQTHTEFVAVFDKIKQLSDHPDERVRRQADAALAKYAMVSPEESTEAA